MIKNIIFDLGGVLLDIDFKKTRDAFTASGIVDFDAYFQQSFSNPLFVHLETGLVEPIDFFGQFRKDAGVQITDEIVIENWNNNRTSNTSPNLELSSVCHDSQ